MHILRTARCFDNVLLLRFDNILRDGLVGILNVSFTHSQWQRASLPVKDGGLGVRTAYSLASSAFLASAVGTLALQNRIVPRISELTDTAFEDCLAFWSDSTSSVSLTEPMSHKQRAWDSVVVGCVRESLFSGCVSPLDRARFLAACAPHSGDWLNAIPIQSCGLLLSDDEVRIAVGLRMGLPLFLQHDCVCGDVMDTLGLHGLACKSGAGKQARHSVINDVVCRSMIRAKIQSVKEPAGLCDGGLRPDGASIIPWKRGRNVTWDVTVADTFATSYVGDAAVCAGRVAERAAAKKIAKYAEMCRNYIFVPLACEVSGVWCTDGLEFLNDLGSRISDVTGDRRDKDFLFQRLSIALQKGNAACMYRPGPLIDTLE